MTRSRRLSQAISEGDGISLIVPVADAGQARQAEADGAEALVVEGEVGGIRDATGLPILWRGGSSTPTPAEAHAAGADAYVVRVGTTDDDRLHELHHEALRLGLESVVGVADEDELELALEYVDPEIILLTATGDDEEELLESVLDLLPDVPAGKLAIAEVAVWTRESVLALERAGMDGVIVRAGEIAHLVGGPPPEV